MPRDTIDDISLLQKMEIQEIHKTEGTKLLEYQEPHAKKLITILEKNGSALDASDPGVGKTYIASYICYEMNLRPIVICPKNVISKWRSVLDDYGVKYVMVVNYELITRGKYLYKGAKLVAPQIKITKKDKKEQIEWKVDSDVIFIFDEVHRCKFLDTHNAKLLLAAKETGNKILMLSGTVVEKPIEFAIFAYILGFSNSLKILLDWIRKLSTPAKTLYTLLYDEKNPKAARITIQELGDKFPDTQITAELYEMKSSKEIEKEYQKMLEKIAKFREEGEKSKFIIAKLQNEFRNIELLKIPTFVELTNDYIENNFSVVIFVNYVDSLNLLKEKLHTNVAIYGGQSLKERDECIDKFQTDKSRVLIANIKAGGVGISLHDITGKHPRVSLISPTTSATNLIQALGRVHRSGGKSKSLQRIIFAAHTPEENISKMLFRKIANLSMLNDGDMEAFYIDGLIEDETLQTRENAKDLDHDIKMAIDKGLEYIKHKNSLKTNKMSKLFPDIIDTISDVREIYLLKGKKLVSDVEIMLLGEHHTENKNCISCKKSCIEVQYLVTYIMHSLYPTKIDLYLESTYNPNLSYKFDKLLGSDKDMSRLKKFENDYRHLLNAKYPATENLRMHAVDVRDSYLTEDYKITISEDILFIYGIMMEMHFQVVGYANMLSDEKLIDWKSTPAGYVAVIHYNRGTVKYDKIYYFVTQMSKLTETETDYEAMKNILGGKSKELYNMFKISKQKKMLLKSYDNSEEANELVDAIQTQIDVSRENYVEGAYRTLDKYRSIFKKISQFKNKIDYLQAFYTQMYYDKLSETPLFVPFADAMSTYMDQYAVFRMLRKFDEKQQTNVIFYGGGAHTDNIYHILRNSGYFSPLVKRTAPENRPDCQHLEKL